MKLQQFTLALQPARYRKYWNDKYMANTNKKNKEVDGGGEGDQPYRPSPFKYTTMTNIIMAMRKSEK